MIAVIPCTVQVGRDLRTGGKLSRLVLSMRSCARLGEPVDKGARVRGVSVGKQGQGETTRPDLILNLVSNGRL